MGIVDRQQPEDCIVGHDPVAKVDEGGQPGIHHLLEPQGVDECANVVDANVHQHPPPHPVQLVGRNAITEANVANEEALAVLADHVQGLAHPRHHVVELAILRRRRFRAVDEGVGKVCLREPRPDDLEWEDAPESLDGNAKHAQTAHRAEAKVVVVNVAPHNHHRKEEVLLHPIVRQHTLVAVQAWVCGLDVYLRQEAEVVDRGGDLHQKRYRHGVGEGQAVVELVIREEDVPSDGVLQQEGKAKDPVKSELGFKPEGDALYTDEEDWDGECS
mmetsp:Transcript_86791/g.201956  ORF Transcript_86791/g.201956 Transcript_86791/m.201956 type:complete len:273 (-) Transcript_86791:61-879(-)